MSPGFRYRFIRATEEPSQTGDAPRSFPLHFPRRATGGAPRKQTVPCAAAPGTTIQPTRARPTATGTIRITEIPGWVFGWCVRATSPRVIFKPLRSLPWRKTDFVSWPQPARPVRSLVELRRSTGPSVPPRPADQGLRDAVGSGGMARVRPVRAAEAAGRSSCRMGRAKRNPSFTLPPSPDPQHPRQPSRWGKPRALRTGERRNTASLSHASHTRA